MKLHTAKLSSKKQITIPKKILESLGITPGDRLVLEIRDDQIVVKPPPKIKSPTRRLYGSVAKKFYAVKAIREFRRTGGRH